MRDIENTVDVKLLIHTFYTQAEKDKLLAPIFEMRINEDEWQKHMDRIIDFWNTVLFFNKAYKGSPFSVHLGLPIFENHFDRWVSLFQETVDSNFLGSKATEAKSRAEKMGEMFLSKLEYYRNNPNVIPIQ